MKIFIVILLSATIYSQQQQHIPWPSFADSPWPTTRGDAQATGRSQYIGPRRPNVILRKDMPLGIIHGPVVGYNDDLFVGTRALTSNNVNYFYSLDKNGENIWTFITEGPNANVAGPTVANDGTIYFSSIGPGGLYAINPDGTLKWNDEKFSKGYLTRYIPIAKNGDIYITWFDTLFVLQPENGNIIDTLYSFLSDIIDGDLVFSAGGDTIFYFTGRIFTEEPKKLNAATKDGEHLWSIEFETFTANRGTPLVDNANRIYVYSADTSINEFLYCINPDGTVNWKYPINYPERYENYSSPTIDGNGNIIFQTSTEDSGYVYSVDYYGNLSWKTTLGHYYYDGAFINSGLVCDAEGKIYCGSSYGASTNFWCLDSNGTILWKLDLEGYQYDTSPAIGSDGTLYIGTHLGLFFQNHVRNLIAVRDTVTFVENNGKEILSYQLEQNYPNPFNSLTHIRYSIPRSSYVSLIVFDILGNEVSTLVNRYQSAGEYDVLFEGNNLASGIYFYTLSSNNFMVTKKIILLK